jgi:AraC-like DNA-binding protein
VKDFFGYSDPVVPLQHPRVIVETAVAQGASKDALLGGVGITRDTLESPAARISYRQWTVLVDNAVRLTENPALGLDAGKNLQIPQMGVLGLALMSSATGGDALQAMLRYYRAIAPIWDLRLELARDVGTLVIGEVIPLKRHRAFAVEALLAAIHTQGEFLLGRSLPVRCARFSYPRPGYADRYRELSDTEMCFGCATTEVDFDAGILEEKIVFGDPITRQLAEQLCAEQSAALGVDGLVEKSRRLLAAAPKSPPALERLARQLRTSERSLQRALQQAGTSYQKLVDEWRRTRALKWVRSTQLTLDEIGERLGFSDVRTFRRAFKRWTGQTPSSFRHSAAGTSGPAEDPLPPKWGSAGARRQNDPGSVIALSGGAKGESRDDVF